MRYNKLEIWKLLLLPTALSLAACGDDKPPLEGSPLAITCDGSLCSVPQGNHLEDMTWSADKTYLLKGKVFIGDGSRDGSATLTIEPGTRILGESASKGYLAILPFSKIIARGTKDKPIVFTSDASVRARGDWGGIIISGNAPVNCGGSAITCQGEGETGAYGGTDASDDSGVLEYVRVEFAGNQVNPTDELNGIAFQGVGSGTTLRYIHVHMAQDDGVEFFGGTVNASHLLLTGIGDDSLDWTFGWNGTARHIITQHYDDDSDNGIEADNNANDHNAEPRSNPTIEYITLIGSPDSDKSDIGVLVRAGTAGQISKAIVAHFNDACVDIDDAATFTVAADANGIPTDRLTLKDSVIWCPSPGKHFKESDGDPWPISEFFLGMGNTEDEDPGFIAPFSREAPDFRTTGSSAADKGGMTEGNWFEGWTEFPQS